MDCLKDICDDAFRETLECQGKKSGGQSLSLWGEKCKARGIVKGSKEGI